MNNSSKRLKFHQLEVFVEIGKHRSVTRAAQALNLTQPAVTRTVRELEEICGATLLAKEGRGIRLTSQGVSFLRYAGASLAAARSGLNAIHDLNRLDRPPIRIGALPTVSALLMPRAVSRYLAEELQISIRVTTGENRVLLDQLRSDDLDLVIGRMPAPESMYGLNFEPLYRDIVVLAVHRSHPLADRQSLNPEEFARYPVLVPTPASIIAPYVERLFLEQGIPQPNRVIETVSDSFGRAFTRDFGAIWIISRGVISSELTTGEFVALPRRYSINAGGGWVMCQSQPAT